MTLQRFLLVLVLLVVITPNRVQLLLHFHVVGLVLRNFRPGVEVLDQLIVLLLVILDHLQQEASSPGNNVVKEHPPVVIYIQPGKVRHHRHHVFVGLDQARVHLLQ